jgi:hypothetical protein
MLLTLPFIDPALLVLAKGNKKRVFEQNMAFRT